MTAFRPISPAAALSIFGESDLDVRALLADLADAGVVKTYARVLEQQDSDGQRESRDTKLPRSVWRQIIDGGKIGDVFSTGSVRLSASSEGGTQTTIVAIGIRFDDKSVLAARADHCDTFAPSATDIPQRSSAPSFQPEPEASIETAAPPPPARRVLPASIPDGALQLSIDRTAAVLGVGRTTVYKMIAEGQLNMNKTRGRSHVTVESIRNHLVA
ncbi:MAG TPA: hypothetical protein VF509_04945 [Sphingobium sp.]